MKKLILAGLGLSKGDITLKLIEKVKESDQVFLEMYTSQIPGVDKNYLENLFDKTVKRVNRSDLEEKSNELFNKDLEVLLILVPGDPLVFTTHISILKEAKERGIETEIIHAPSIYSAVSETGLFLYKFGKTTTIPYPEEGYMPESPYDTIKLNKKNGLHTLVLLDIKEEEKKYMTPKESLEYLLKIEEKRKENVVLRKEKIVVASKLGVNSVILYNSVEKLLKQEFKTPSIIVFPGKLSEMEKEYLEKYQQD